MSAAARVTTLVVLVGLGCLAATPYDTVYVDGVPVQALLAVVLGAAVSLVLDRLRVRPWLALPILLTTLVVYVGAATSDRVIAGFVPTLGSLADVGIGATAGWKDVLTVGLPTAADGRLVAGPVTLLFVVGWSSVTLARRAHVAAVIPSMVGLTIGLAVAGQDQRPSIGPSLLAPAGVLLFLALRSAAAGQPPTVGPTGAGRSAKGGWSVVGAPVAAAIAIAAVLAGTLAPVADDASRFDLRSIVSQPVVVRDDLSPLTRVASQLQSDAELFDLEVSGSGELAPEALFLSVATLDAYDGVSWTTSATFPRAARELDHDRRGGEVEIDAEVTLSNYGSSFLPILRQLVRVDDPDLGYSPATDTLVSGEPGRDGYRYQFTAEVVDPARDRELAAADDAAGGDAARPYLTLPAELPAAVVDVAEQVQSGASTTFTRLDLLRDAIAGRNTNAGARPGHSLARIARFLGADGDAQATSIGTAEQGAAAFALVARLLGVPSRLVVGYQPRDVRPGEPVTVLASDIHVVAEVLFADTGWVRFDPRPENEVELPDEDGAPIVPDPDDAADVEDQAPPADPEIGALPQPAPSPDEVGAGGRLGVWRWVMAVGMSLLAVLAMPVTAKAARRRYRRHGTPERRVLGALAEVRDRLRERGHAATDAMTMHELVVATSGGVPVEVAGAGVELAGLADRALFGRAAPSDHMAVRAWELEQVVRRELSAGAGVVARARHRLDPRPLWTGRTKRMKRSLGRER